MANKIAIEITVDDKGSATIKQFGENAAQSLKGTSAAAEKTDSAFTGMVGTLKNMIGLAAAAFGVHEIVGFGKEAVMLAARVETLGVVLGVVGENAGYSRAEMVKYVEEVKRMGITTEVAHDAVIKIAQAQIDVADSAKLARIAQDAAVIGNINSSEAFQRMINGIRSGEVEILKTIGLNVQFEQGYQRMAQQLGKSADSLSNQEKAQARANLVMEAGTRIAGAYEASMGTAGKMMLSMSRLTDELKLGLGELFSGALTDAVVGITGYLKDINKYMEQMRDSGALSDVTDMVSSGLKIAWLFVRDIILAVWEAIKPIGPMISDMLPILGLVASGWGYIVAALKPVGVIIGEIITSVFNLGKLVGSAFGALGAALAGDFASAKAYATQLDQTWAALGKSAKNAYAAVKDGIAESMIAHEKELNAALTVSKKKTAAEIAAEEAVSKARATAAKAANDLLKKQDEDQKKSAELRKKLEQERLKGEKTIIEAIRKNAYEAEMIGKSQYDKDVIRIEQEVDKFRKAKVDEKLIAEYVYSEMEKAAKNAYEAMAKAARKASDVAIDEMEKQIAEGVKMSKETLDRLDKEAKEKEKLREDQLKAERDLYTDLRGYETQYYEASKRLIDEQAKKYRQLGVDEIAIAAWVTEERIKLVIKKAKSEDDFVAGVLAGIEEMQRAQKTWGEVGYDMITAFATGSIKQLDDNLFLLLKGRWGEMSIDFGAILDEMLRILTAKIAEMIIQWGLYYAALAAVNALGLSTAQGTFAGDLVTSLKPSGMTGTGLATSAVGGALESGISTGTASGAASGAMGGVGGAGGGYVGGQIGGEIGGPTGQAVGTLVGAYGGKYAAGALAEYLGLSATAPAVGAGASSLGAAGASGAYVFGETAAPFVVDTSLELGAAAGAEAAAGAAAETGSLSGTSTLGTAAIPFALVAAAGMFIENVLRPLTEHDPTMNQYNPASWADASFYNYLFSPAHIWDTILGRISPAEKRDVWKAEYDAWYRDMAYYFGQNIPQTVTADQAWLQSQIYLGGGYPAERGLDYVPYDRFPIIAHKGEAVLPAEEADDWRGGSTRGGVNITFNFPNAVVVERAAVNELAEKIYPRLEYLRSKGY